MRRYAERSIECCYAVTRCRRRKSDGDRCALVFARVALMAVDVALVIDGVALVAAPPHARTTTPTSCRWGRAADTRFLPLRTRVSAAVSTRAQSSEGIALQLARSRSRSWVPHSRRRAIALTERIRTVTITDRTLHIGNARCIPAPRNGTRARESALADRRRVVGASQCHPRWTQSIVVRGRRHVVYDMSSTTCR